MWAWALLPVIFAVFGMLGIWTVFGLAVSNETVNLTVEFPYISTCGTYNPQSCLFSQICNICSVLAMWVVIIRFQQVRDLNCASRVNTASLILGFISSIGISILGNFQQSVVMGAHLLGAFLAFFVGLAYFWLQVWLTYHAKPSQDKKWVGPARIIFCSICTCLVVAMSVLHNTGYRSASAMCEWALVTCFFMLFGIFSAEFRHIDFHELHVQKKGFSEFNPEFPPQESSVVEMRGQ
ncbi:modulator of macroautophagy TMEM150B isoform X1 [Tachysurus fulvidraco]|uniref:modulator of macroautophagy TMEM150B isoform X1 n=1 Tax=Tachysurus fulvidraco TaxID=1234273 RepID=UPI000F4DD920|nr:modulator of macroautophagy TMEM150B isoform X1 [Tachysurus fulvidraco]